MTRTLRLFKPAAASVQVFAEQILPHLTGPAHLPAVSRANLRRQRLVVEGDAQWLPRQPPGLRGPNRDRGERARARVAAWWAAVSSSSAQQFRLDLTYATLLPRKTEVKLRAGAGGQHLVGAAFAEAAGHVIRTCEFVDDDQFSNLEALLVQNGVKEVIHCEQSHAALDKLNDVFERTGVVVTVRKSKDFSAADVEQDLKRLLGNLYHNLPQLDQKTVMAATAALITYLDLLSDDTNSGGFTMQQYTLKDYMRLDTAVVRALNLLPQPNDSQNRASSLYGLLNQCKTPMGSRLLNLWLKQPLLDVTRIKERHSIVAALVDDHTLRQRLSDECLRTIGDIRRYVKKFQRGNAGLQDLIVLYEVTNRLPCFIECLQDYEGPHTDLLSEHFVTKFENYQQITVQFCNMVETAIDMEALAQGLYFVRDSFDEELAELRAELDEVRGEIDAHHEATARKFGLGTDKLGLHEKYDNVCKGWVFRLTQKQEQQLRHKIQKGSILQANKQGAYITSPELRMLSSRYSDAKRQYETSQQDLVLKVTDVARTYTAVFQNMEGVIAELDVLLSFAVVAVNAPIPYVRPEMLPCGEGTITIEAARHPCVEVVQEDRSFIANDVSLRRDGECGLLQIITGPNMGGKSTYIRQVGVILLMAQIGSFVPADEATLSVVDCILARVGAGDSQLRGVSTFMSEMLETAAILRTATKNSFIIVDELGRGTSTYDGFGLAWAIAEHLAQTVKAPCMFATHFHELTDLATKEPSVQNRHVVCNDGGGCCSCCCCCCCCCFIPFKWAGGSR
eukprot:SAG25_NODE_46_length_19040_cov_20.665699_7_plen_790_part_00